MKEAIHAIALPLFRARNTPMIAATSLATVEIRKLQARPPAKPTIAPSIIA
jgi:hypothetical protein